MSKRKFKNGDKVIVYNHSVKKIGNPSVIWQPGVIIGASRVSNGKLCIEFEKPLVGCGSGNSLRFLGKPFSCYWVYEEDLKEYNKEVLKELEGRKDQIEQESIDRWYGAESYA